MKCALGKFLPRQLLLTTFGSAEATVSATSTETATTATSSLPENVDQLLRESDAFLWRTFGQAAWFGSLIDAPIQLPIPEGDEPRVCASCHGNDATLEGFVELLAKPPDALTGNDKLTKDGDSFVSRCWSKLNKPAAPTMTIVVRRIMTTNFGSVEAELQKALERAPATSGYSWEVVSADTYDWTNGDVPVLGIVLGALTGDRYNRLKSAKAAAVAMQQEKRIPHVGMCLVKNTDKDDVGSLSKRAEQPYLSVSPYARLMTSADAPPPVPSPDDTYNFTCVFSKPWVMHLLYESVSAILSPSDHNNQVLADFTNTCARLHGNSAPLSPVL